MLPPLVAGPLVGLLTLLIAFALAGYVGRPRTPIEPPTLTRGAALAQDLPLLVIDDQRDALLGGYPVRAGTIPGRARLRGAKRVRVLADRCISTQKLGGWLTVLRHLDVADVQLVVEDARGRRRAIDTRLDDVRPGDACDSSLYGRLIDDHRILLEQVPRATLRLGPRCLELIPRWLER